MSTPQTIYTQEPGKYHMQKTVGGWVVVFIEDRNTLRQVDGGRVHKKRQNAWQKADRLNHPLKYIFKKHDMAEVYYDGYTAIVSKEDRGYCLSIQHETMPPFFSEPMETLEQVEAEMATTHCPQPIKWQAVKPEEI